jgi:predicted transcriptional regulator of viral defense system
MALVDPAAISHWSALHRHGLTEQLPWKVFVLTTVTTSVPRSRGAKVPQSNGGYRVSHRLAPEFSRAFRPKKQTELDLYGRKR